ncbi:MAG: Dna2/Cas4 domain-containing protein [Candidatus Aenigmatarchaeota archaeon]
MRFSVEYDDDSFEKTVSILKNFAGKEVSLFEIEKECIKNNIISTDYLFILLQHLNIKGVVEANKGIIKIREEIGKEIIEEAREIIKRKLSSVYKLFLTPLEVAKFFQCPRRLWLEKIVLAKQEKEKVGKVWDGEALHLSIKNFIENLGKKEENVLIKESVNYGLKIFEGAVQIKSEEMEEIVKKFMEEIKRENFDLILPERTIFSIRLGLIGSIDLIAFKGEDLYPIEIKHASYRGRIKREHLIQSIGEALLLGNYFRTHIKHSFIFYSQTNSLVKIDISKKNVENFMRTISKIFRIYSSNRIPPKSRLPNYRERVCKGCHVKLACDNIEKIRKRKV